MGWPASSISVRETEELIPYDLTLSIELCCTNKLYGYCGTTFFLYKKKQGYTREFDLGPGASVG